MGNRQPQRLRIIICGAGLAGLGAAVALSRKGHDVTVVESAVGLSEVGAGIQIPPNSTSILHEYGLTLEFLKKIVWPQHFAFRRYASGELLGTTPLHPHLTRKYGYPYWLIHRADFQRILFDAAESQGAKILLSSTIDSIDSLTPSVKLCSGEVLRADLVIGADGIRSKTRQAILDHIVEPEASSNNSYRATVSKELMAADPEVAHLMTDINANCWIGPGHHIMAYPIRQGEMYNLVMSHPADHSNANAGFWNRPGDLTQMRDHYKSFDTIIQKVLSKVTTCLDWKIADLPSISTWVSTTGKVVILGDAAHAMVPFLAQGAAQAIEDGACLAECLDRLTTQSQLPLVLRAFEAIRKPRTDRIQQATRDSSNVWHLPDGPAQEARDEAFKSMALEARDEILDRQLAQANPNSLSSSEFQPWLFGHNVFQATNAALDEMSIFDNAAKKRDLEFQVAKL